MSRESGVGRRESGVGRRESGEGRRESGVGSREITALSKKLNELQEFSFLYDSSCFKYFVFRTSYFTKKALRCQSFGGRSRDDWIRTSDPYVPNVVRYRAALHPVIQTGVQK